MSVENRIKKLETKSAESFTTEEISSVMRLRDMLTSSHLGQGRNRRGSAIKRIKEHDTRTKAGADQ